jgi:2-iminobutanoate/2-iminopropanoate deaminase
MQRRDINAADAPAPAGQYTQAVEVTAATRTLYLSGQVGVAADGSIPENAEAQSALAWQNLQAQLRAAGMGIENLVKITTIVCNPADIAAVRAGRASVLGAYRPASTLIVGGLSNAAWKVEVEAIAVA